MKVNILKSEKNYMVSSPYNRKLLKLIKSINKKYWCRESKLWFLPIDSLEQFKEELKKDVDFEVLISELKTCATITPLDDFDIEISFSRYIDKFREFMDLSEQRYIQGSRKIILPAKLMDKVINLCKKFDYEVNILSK